MMLSDDYGVERLVANRRRKKVGGGDIIKLKNDYSLAATLISEEKYCACNGLSRVHKDIKLVEKWMF